MAHQDWKVEDKEVNPAMNSYRFSPPKREESVEQDVVNHPSHYKAGGVETIDFISKKVELSPWKCGEVYLTGWHQKPRPD